MSDMLSQEEIDALLKGTTQNSSNTDSRDLDNMEKDALGEIGNISMGTSATTLFTLLGQKVTITTPKISVITMDELAKQYPIPFVTVEVKYKEGLEGTNLLVLKEDDVKVITDLMMGGDGTKVSGELTELHLSAIGEAMNQMIGSASTSLSEMFQKKIDIEPPKAVSMKLSDSALVEGMNFIKPDHKIVKIAFKMVVGNIIDSEIMQIIPIEFAKDLVDKLLNISYIGYEDDHEKTMINESNQSFNSHPEDDNYTQNHMDATYDTHVPNMHFSTEQSNISRNESVKVQPVQFQSFDEMPLKHEKENISLIKDVPLEVTVELGRTTKRISEILEFSSGTVIELDKLVGEPLDILINGQFMAKGEVVVIDENYGIRVTDILNSAKRTNKIK
ncbi:flagellar motor switch phosphatase FliY [Clostridiaceae bacterium 35-E11]